MRGIERPMPLIIIDVIFINENSRKWGELMDILLVLIILLLLGYGGGLYLNVGVWVHLLLVVAVICFIFRLLTGRNPL